MKARLNALIRWPWWPAAVAASIVLPWIVYAVAGYIEADAQFQLAAGALHWMTPSPDVLPVAGLVAFVAVILIGLAADRFRARRG